MIKSVVGAAFKQQGQTGVHEKPSFQGIKKSHPWFSDHKSHTLHMNNQPDSKHQHSSEKHTHFPTEQHILDGTAAFEQVSWSCESPTGMLKSWREKAWQYFFYKNDQIALK